MLEYLSSIVVVLIAAITVAVFAILALIALLWYDQWRSKHGRN